MAGRSISALIKLEGAEEIQRLLTAIGKTGAKSFEEVAAAVEAANSKMEPLSNAVAGVEKSFAKLQEAGKSAGQAFAKVGGEISKVVKAVASLAGIGGVASITGLTVAILAMAKSAADASDQLVRNSQATGLTIQEYAAFARAARQAGIDHEQFVAGMRKFSGDVVESAKKEKEAITELAVEVAKLRFDKKEPGVFQVLPKADIQKQLDAIRTIAPEIQAAFANIGKKVSVDQIVADLQKLVREGHNLAPLFQKLGLPFPTGSIIDGLKQAAEQGSTALAKLGVRTTEVIDGVLQIRSTSSVLLDAADAFSKLAEGPAKVALAAELLGRAGPQFMSFLNLGRAGLQDMIAKFDQFGIRLTDAEIKIGQKMNRSLEALSGTINGVKNKIGALFQPAILQASDALRQKVLENSQEMIKFGATVRDWVVPILEDLILLISGRDAEVKNTWLLKARDNVIAFGSAVVQAVTGIIMPAFELLLAGLQKIADGINAVFGTKLTGGQIGIAIAVAQMLGLFTTLGAVIFAVVAGVKLLTAVFHFLVATVRAAAVIAALFAATPLGLMVLAIAGIIAAIVLLIVYWDEVKEVAGKAWDFIIRKSKEAWEWIKAFVSTPIADAWKWIAETFDAAIEKVKKKAKDAWDEIKKFFTLPEGTLPGAGPGASPMGGPAAPEPSVLRPASLTTQSDPSQLTDKFKTATTALETLASTALQLIKSLATEAAAAVGETLAALVTTAQTSVQTLTSIFAAAGSQIGQIFVALSATMQGVMSALEGAIAAIGAQITSIVANVISELQAAVAAAQALAAAAAQAAAAAAGFGGVGSAPYASGGYTGAGGRLTPAGIVHRGEYVQPARVVGRPGVLAFMEMLRRSGDLQATIQRFTRGFDAGGLVDGLSRSLAVRGLPGFAAGGLAAAPAGGRHVTVDLRTNAGTFTMTTDEDTAVALTRVARRSGNNATMRRAPMWDR